MKSQIQDWLQRDPDPNTRAELQELINDQNTDQLQSRFAGRLQFGTAGLRGLLGAGPARMNRLVVQETTAGLGNYLQETIKGSQQRGVVIGYDGRNGSLQFAKDSACVLAGLGFRVFLFDRMIPTPTCAFAITKLGACAGIMITASHNPPDYNGYKAYWENGAQIIPPHDQGIADKIVLAANNILPWKELENALADGEITYIEQSLIESYLQGIEARALYADESHKHNLKIVYSPLHGVGAELTEACMHRAGFDQFYAVPTQRKPDGLFPTVKFPNPEEPGAMDASIQLAQELGADLVVANDPDADRLAVALPSPDGSYYMLSGDQIGCILGHALLEVHKGKAIAVGSTIVSSRLLSVMAKEYGAKYFETLTGFKWIANQAIELKEQGLEFLLGYEEAIGFTIGDLVRDKDGISALLNFALLTSKLQKEGKTIGDYLEQIHRRYGLHLTTQKSLALSPTMNAGVLGEKLRSNPPTQIAGQEVVAVSDYLRLTTTFKTGAEEEIVLPQSDVITFYLEDNSRIIIRPSGTEPKIKCYYETIVQLDETISHNHALTNAQMGLETLMNQHQIELSLLTSSS